jgi:protein-S-isoprenylcysteine O-methyltransferase Ste14
MSKSTRIDPGRVIMVPIFVFFLIQVACVIVIRGRNLSPVTVPKVLNLIYSVLVACFYVLMVVLYLVRTSATATTPSLVTKVIAVGATFLPFTLLVLPEPMVKRAALVAGGDLIMLLGIGLSVYALGTLGRSFSIIPQARRLMRSGAYRIVRHPLYLGEPITMFGAVLASATAARAAVCLLLVACQVYPRHPGGATPGRRVSGVSGVCLSHRSIRSWDILRPLTQPDRPGWPCLATCRRRGW